MDPFYSFFSSITLFFFFFVFAFFSFFWFAATFLKIFQNNFEITIQMLEIEATQRTDPSSLFVFFVFALFFATTTFSFVFVAQIALFISSISRIEIEIDKWFLSTNLIVKLIILPCLSSSSSRFLLRSLSRYFF